MGKTFKYHKICKCCGKPFDTNSPQKEYCDRDHYLPCPVCGKLVKKTDRDFTRPPKCCSKECSKKLRQSKFKLRVCEVCGHEFTPKSGSQKVCEDCKAKNRKSVLPQKECVICHKMFTPNHANQTICNDDHYLVCPVCGKKYVHNSTSPSYGCSRSCAAKASMSKKRKTNMSRFGVPYATQASDIKQKTINTNVKKYGVPNPMKAPEIAERSKQNRVTSYKDSFEKAKNTLIRNYGVDNPSKSSEFIDKMTHAFVRKYGIKRAMNVPEFRKKLEATMTERYGFPYYVESKEDLNESHFRISAIKKEVSNKLESNGIHTEFEYAIGIKQYDIKIVNSNTLIEVDSTYTHNTIGNPWNPSGLDKNYHLEKTKLAEDNGFKCIHIFDWDNVDKIVSMLAKKKVIYARNCDKYIIKPEVARKFMNDNHLQGSCRGQVFCVGLVHEGELVEVMTFGKPRYNKNYDLELLRLCAKARIEVVGGASKLFKWVTNYFEFNNVISYCDRSKFRGSVYTEMGMTQLKDTLPQEIWSKGSQKITSNLLRDRGYDQLFNTNYGKGASNELLMVENGWLPVYDCGQKVFEYRK